MPERLVLIGMMGAGKSTVGRLLAERLGRHFVDVDDEIVRAAGGSVADIFAGRVPTDEAEHARQGDRDSPPIREEGVGSHPDGEQAFRHLERSCLRRALQGGGDLVVAAGGGAVLDADNRTRMRQAGTVIWLRAQPATLSKRVGDGRGRPLLQASTSGSLAVLTRLSAERALLYEEVADAVVDVDGLTAAQVVDRIVGLVTR